MAAPNLSEIATTTLRNRGAKMPIGPTNTKAQKQKVVQTEMHKFKGGDLHSGSKQGPVVKNRNQAVAIALSESGQSKKKEGPKMGKPTFGNVGAKKDASHLVEKSGVGHEKQAAPKGLGIGKTDGKAEHHPSFGPASSFRQPPMNNAHGFGHGSGQKSGPLRNSGVAGAHRLGKR